MLYNQNMSFKRAEIERYFLEFEKQVLGQKYYAPILLNNATLLFFNQNKENGFISLSARPENPLFYCYKSGKYYTSIESKFNKKFRSITDELMLVDLRLEKSAILTLRFAISNDEKEDLIIHFEFFQYKPNIIITNVENKILFSLTHDKVRPLIPGEIYIPLEGIPAKESDDKITLDLIKKHYLHEQEIRYKEKYGEFVTSYKVKIKRINRKIQNIKDDVKKAELQQNYQQIADEILSNEFNLQDKVREVKVKNEVIQLDQSKTIIENVQNLYKKAKKARHAIELAETNIFNANQELEMYQEILDKFIHIENEKDKDKFVQQYSFSKKREAIKTEFNRPWKINWNGTIFYFGKNASQNDYLSFVMKLDRSFLWYHIENLSGAHIVIAKTKPTDSEKLFACELALYCSKQKTGEVTFTQKKNIRRGHTLGEAILKHHETIKINRIREESISLFDTAVRCN